MEFSLPFSPPLINCWSYQGALMGILQSSPQCTNWIFSNYIQIFTLVDLETSTREYALDFYWGRGGDWQYFEHKTNPWINYYKIPRSILARAWNSPHEFVVSQILEKKYVYLPLNTRYIQNHSLNYYHTILIWGFDDIKQIFYCSDNCKNGAYSSFSCNYDELDNAVLSNDNFTDLTFRSEDYDVTLFQLRSLNEVKQTIYSQEITLQLKKIKNDIGDYLSGFPYDCEKQPGYRYGIDCYQSLESYIEAVLVQHRHIDLRPLSCFIDHKRIMDARVAYLIEQKLLPEYVSYRSILNRLLSLRFCLLKERTSRKNPYQAITHVKKELNACSLIERVSLTNLANNL